jgi:hypothetical protein
MEQNQKESSFLQFQLGSWKNYLTLEVKPLPTLCCHYSFGLHLCFSQMEVPEERKWFRLRNSYTFSQNNTIIKMILVTIQ